MRLFEERKEETVKPLVDIIGLALNRVTYKKLLERIKQDQTIDDLNPIANSELAKGHREKILREEINKQFSHDYRPIIELILNGIDAKPRDYKGDYFVNINLNKKKVEIWDSGEGMDIEKILTTLLIPFSSNRDPEKNIGRFGVGFFSSLGYCTANPGSVNLSLTTTKDKSKYIIDFKAKDENVKSLLCSISKGIGTRKGTRVRVKFPYNIKKLKRYITSYLNFFDPERAKIKINNKIINEPKNNPHIKEYLIKGNSGESSCTGCRIKLEKIEERPIIPLVWKKFKSKTNISFYSQGILINSAYFPNYNIKIDFPSDILLVEGRDEFKRDENYLKLLKDMIGYICKNNKKIVSEFDPAFDISDLLVNLTHSSVLNNYNFYEAIIETIAKNKDYLFEKGTYIIKDCDMMERYIDTIDFFGKEIKPFIYTPKSVRSYSFWSEILPGFDELIKSKTKKAKISLQELLESSPGLGLINKEIDIRYGMGGNENLNLLTLDSKEETKSTFIGSFENLYLNANHPLLTKDDFFAKYMLKSYFTRIIHGEKEADYILING